MSMRIRFIVCVCLAIASRLMAQDSGSSSHSLADRFENLSCSLVRIASDDGTYGTGFFVSDEGTVVTAAHVVMKTAYSLIGRRLVHVEMTPKANLKVITEYGAKRDVELTASKDDEEMAAVDLAVIRTTFTPRCHLVIGDSQSVRVGAHLIAIGYPTFDTLSPVLVNPKANPTPALYEGFLSSRHPHAPIMVLGLLSQPQQFTYDVLRIQMPVTGGASGSPVLTDDDKVIGVVTEETSFWPPELTDYANAIDKMPDDAHSVDKVKLATGQEVDVRKILGTLALTVREFESPGAGLAVPTVYLKLSTVVDH